MLIGVPKEIKVHEYRVGMTPSSVREAVVHGHHVIMEANAGAGISAGDDDYRKAGAEVVSAAADHFNEFMLAEIAKWAKVIKGRIQRAQWHQRLKSWELPAPTIRTRMSPDEPGCRALNVPRFSEGLNCWAIRIGPAFASGRNRRRFCRSS